MKWKIFRLLLSNRKNLIKSNKYYGQIMNVFAKENKIDTVSLSKKCGIDIDQWMDLLSLAFLNILDCLALCFI